MAGLRPDILGIDLGGFDPELTPEAACAVDILAEATGQLEQIRQMLGQARAALAQGVSGAADESHLNAVLFHHGEFAEDQLGAASDYLRLLATALAHGRLAPVAETLAAPEQPVSDDI